jgi:hypothetical protein
MTETYSLQIKINNEFHRIPLIRKGRFSDFGEDNFETFFHLENAHELDILLLMVEPIKVVHEG